jgi:apolipoprotein D and lipocalin family protein
VNLLLIVVCALLGSNTAFAMGRAPLKSNPEVVTSVDLNRYSGLWHEVAHSPNFFQRARVSSTAQYEVLDEKSLSVLNVCHKANGKTSQISGVASIPDAAFPAKLKVRFSFFQKGDYWITELDDQYQWAVVSSPGKKFTFILARQPIISVELKSKIVALLKAKDFTVNNLVFDRPALVQ